MNGCCIPVPVRRQRMVHYFRCFSLVAASACDGVFLTIFFCSSSRLLVARIQRALPFARQNKLFKRVRNKFVIFLFSQKSCSRKMNEISCYIYFLSYFSCVCVRAMCVYSISPENVTVNGTVFLVLRFSCLGRALLLFRKNSTFRKYLSSATHHAHKANEIKTIITRAVRLQITRIRLIFFQCFFLCSPFLSTLAMSSSPLTKRHMNNNNNNNNNISTTSTFDILVDFSRAHRVQTAECRRHCILVVNIELTNAHTLLMNSQSSCISVMFHFVYLNGDHARAFQFIKNYKL